MITEEQRQLRKKGLGSSDVAAVVGEDPFKSAWDIWADKTGLAEDFKGNEATERGNFLEGAVLDWAEKELGVTLVRHEFVALEGSPLCCNLDARGEKDGVGFIVEAKTSSHINDWGEAGTDQVPYRVIIQTHVAMKVTGLKLAYVPVLVPAFGRFDFRMYRLDYNPDLAEAIAGFAEKFWREHVLTKIPPTNSLPSLEVAKRIRRVPNQVREIPDETVEAWLRAKEEASRAEKSCKEAERAIHACLLEAEAGTCGLGELTYFKQERKGYVVEPSSFRQLRFKAAKGRN